MLFTIAHMKSETIKGYMLAAFAAIFYGTNPAFAVPLYHLGMSPAGVLIGRYLLGMPLLAAWLLCHGAAIVPRKTSILPVCAAGLIMAISSLALYESYRHMNSGLASTLLFMYPILTAMLMTLVFHEPIRRVTAASLLIMAAGLYLLGWSGSQSVTPAGLALVFISALAYSIYLIMFKTWKPLMEAPPVVSLLWQLGAGTIFFAAVHFLHPSGEFANSAPVWLNLFGLALVPTVLSLLFTIWAVRRIGPTATAIFGALEPVTAVCLSAFVLAESITAREALGGALIICAAMLEAAPGKKPGKK